MSTQLDISEVAEIDYLGQKNMVHTSHIARPYALAAFQCAREKEKLSAWKAFLQSAAYMACDPQVMFVLANPEILTMTVFALFESVLLSQLDAERKNFLQLLAQNKRLMILPDIAETFNAYCAQLEKFTKVQVVTAIDMQEACRNKLADALKQRIHCDVTLQCDVDPFILGGAVVHIGDMVIDGSLRGKLARLLESLLR